MVHVRIIHGHFYFKGSSRSGKVRGKRVRVADERLIKFAIQKLGCPFVEAQSCPPAVYSSHGRIEIGVIAGSFARQAPDFAALVRSFSKILPAYLQEILPACKCTQHKFIL
jgi:hypothetical protein